MSNGMRYPSIHPFFSPRLLLLLRVEMTGNWRSLSGHSRTINEQGRALYVLYKIVTAEVATIIIIIMSLAIFL